MTEDFAPSAVPVREVEVRPVRADKRRRWDAWIDQHHYLGFKQFAGRGLRQVAVGQGYWLALLGGHRSVSFRRLHRIGNHTRFLMLPEASGIANRASRILRQSRQRLSGGWLARHGHPLGLAETFVDPSRFRGTCYRASNWIPVGLT